MTSDFGISLREAATQRLEGVESLDGLTVALPASYLKRPRDTFPLAIVPRAAGMLGSAIEMSRLMAQTKEISACILALAEAPAEPAAVEARCRERYRVARRPAIVLDGASVPALVTSLRGLLGAGREYGAEIVPLRTPWLMHSLRALSPLLGRLTAKPAQAAANPHRIRSELMDRDFEVFVAPPARMPTQPIPALIVLDANIEFSTVAETAARMAADAEIADLAVIGVGVPRSEGPLEFAFRRFEEFSPPTAGYDFNDELGRIFRSLFAIRGQDARKRLGRAPEFLRFLSRELLPRLSRELPLDLEDLGLLGHSAGGTFVGYALAQPDAPFRRYAAISPGIGISGSWLLRQPATVPAQRAQTVFLGLGSEELTNAFNVIAGIPDTEAYAQRLRQYPGLSVQFACFASETHSSVYPRAVEQALFSLYRHTAELPRRKQA